MILAIQFFHQNHHHSIPDYSKPPYQPFSFLVVLVQPKFAIGYTKRSLLSCSPAPPLALDLSLRLRQVKFKVVFGHACKEGGSVHFTVHVHTTLPTSPPWQYKALAE